MVNDAQNQLPLAICLKGPTASGKSNMAVQLAKQLGCDIISVDSAMVYKGMDIGTAKPTIEQMQGIPHHLIDILDPAEAFSAAQFRDKALAVIKAIQQNHRIPLLVGGTMLYFRALLQGLSPLPPANKAVRRRIDKEARARGWSAMHDELAVIDPVAASRIHPNDPQRIQRALEVFRLSGKLLTDHCREPVAERLPFKAVNLVIDPGSRRAMGRRIELRFLQMLDQGLVGEVEKLFERGDLDEACPSIRAVGYRQVWSYLNGRLDRYSMVERAVTATRQLAKRQITWLRKETTPYIYPYESENLIQLILRDIEPLVM